MKISIIYYSESGNTKNVAEIIAKGSKISNDIEVKTMDIDHIDKDFVQNSRALIIGCPTYAGSLAWQMKKWLDTLNINIEGKIGSVFVTENHLGGGADFAELTIIGALLVRGMIIYSAGTSKGDPYTHFGAVLIKDGDEKQKERAKLFGKRVANKAMELFEHRKL